MEAYAPNGSTYHSTVRMIEDGDKRNATNLAAAPEDLADNIEYIRARTTGRVGSTANMIAHSDPVDGGELFFTTDNGVYSYNPDIATVDSALNPWVVKSTGLAGSWVQTSRLLLVGTSNPPKILPALLPTPGYPIIVGANSFTCGNFDTPQHLTSQSYAQLVASDGSQLNFSVICVAADRVRISVGPFTANTTDPSHVLTLAAKVTDDTATVYYPFTLVDATTSTAAATKTAGFEFEHRVVKGPISVFIMAKVVAPGPGDGNGYIRYSNFGPSGVQYARITVIRGA